MTSPERDYLGLDVGGTFLKGARVSAAGLILERLHEPIAAGSTEALLAQLCAAVATLGGGLAGGSVGVGLPGIVDRGRRVQNAPALPALNGVAVAEAVGRRTGLRVHLENDANAAGLAEAWIGSGRDVGSVLFVTLGTGIGAGLVLDGRVWAGRSGYAGELGHFQVEPGGELCPCGSRGCLETVAGAPGWKRRAEERLSRTPSSLLAGRMLEPKTIVEAARAADVVALEVVNGAAAALGVGLAAALDLLNLERVVIGGGVSAAGAFLFDRIVAETRRRTFSHVFADCSFRLAALGSDAGVLGAARVAMLAEADEPSSSGSTTAGSLGSV